MSITDELREWASYNRHYDFIESSGGGHCELLAIADRIDEQHRRALEKVSAMVEVPVEYRIASDCDGKSLARELHELEKRVSIIERKLNHRGER